MLKTRIKRRADQADRAAERLALVETSIVALPDEDLLDLADIFKTKTEMPLAEIASAEMKKRAISL